MIRRTIRLVAFTLTATGIPLSAQPAQVNADKEGLGLSGYDPVAYFAAGKPVPGNATLTATHAGVTYRFSSAAHRDSFSADPGKFLPQYGGFCAYGVASGYKVKIDPEAWSIVDGKLYLNYDKRVQTKWLGDVPGYIAKANRNWPELRDKPRR